MGAVRNGVYVVLYGVCAVGACRLDLCAAGVCVALPVSLLSRGQSVQDSFRAENYQSGSVDVDAVCCLSGVALRSAPFMGSFSNAIVQRAVSVFSVPWPTFFSNGPCGPCTVKSSRVDVPHCTAGSVCALSA